MAEYIDREALEAKLNERLTYLLKDNGAYDHFTCGYDEAFDTVENFPSTADVVPVVRCKDCKWAKRDIVLNKHKCTRGLLTEVREDDFCSYGGRKDGDE